MERLLPLLWLIIFSCRTVTMTYPPLVQETEISFPFESLYAESSYKSNGVLVDGWEIFDWEDTIKLDSGYILLAHYSGKLLEIDGDTTVSIKYLNGLIQLDRPVQKISLKYLLETSGKAPWREGHYIQHPGFIEFIFPLEQIAEMNIKEPICLIWTSDNPKFQEIEYDIKIKNMFDEILLEDRVYGNIFQLELKRLGRHLEESLFIIELEETSNPDHNGTIGIELTKTKDPLNPCLMNSPIDQVQLAIELERKQWISEAYEFYKLAADISDKPIYDDLLKNFIKRHGMIN